MRQARQLHRVLIAGIRHALWHRLCDELVFIASQLTGLELFAVPLFPDAVTVAERDALRAIRRAIRAGWPVLIALMDSYDHSSVIVGFTRTRFLLFDSWTYRWTQIASLSFDPTIRGNPHFVPPANVVAMCAY